MSARAAESSVTVDKLPTKVEIRALGSYQHGPAGSRGNRCYQDTRGGAGSPCASCHEITGLRSTPIRSISASITSPGLRYSDAASSLKPATPLTVPVETTSPAENPSGE